MNIYKSLNEITQYIENNLEENIEYEALAKILGVNTYTLQQVFSLIAGISLSDYIRKRKLSSAGFDLYNKKEKLIDVAIKYNYTNATSFSRAFTSFHGIKPSKIKEATKLKNFPRITFDETIKISDVLEYEIIELDNIELYGIGIETNNKRISIDAPNFFEKAKKEYEKKYGQIKFGMVTYDNKTRNNCKKYYILYEYKIDNFEKIIIPKSKWLSFRINSQNAKEIQDMVHKFYLNFLPSCRYNLKEIPELEYYHDGVTDFLIAIY